jgi:hypothetical protein
MKTKGTYINDSPGKSLWNGVWGQEYEERLKMKGNPEVANLSKQ